MNEKPVATEIIPATDEAIWAMLPPEARCPAPTPHPPHAYEFVWGDMGGWYACDGNGGPYWRAVPS